ncbi:TAXI family TRAP transporter solute-binding subunit [Falsiroseomonas sp. CW058]|uniref:TAXI family TRAP transporter solute-binding subunit n=1 Tax=Falsiroseomonas sp. CW058 TaxID=3388664 RepID=UPI003D321A86
MPPEDRSTPRARRPLRHLRAAWPVVVTFIRSWGLMALLVAGGLAIAYRFVAPPPPATLRIATGPGEDSAYSVAVARYAEALRGQGFAVELVASEGSVRNLELLRDRRVDFALVQGGVAEAGRGAGLVSLGSVFFEPAWVFLRRDAGIGRLPDARGRRVAIGPEGSGTRVLALALLEANAVPADAIIASPLAGAAAAAALLAGEVDAAVFVSATPGQGIGTLMRAPDRAMLVDFEERAGAYATLLPALTPVRLPRSGFSLPEDLPAEDIVMLAPAAALLAQADVHPQLVSLFIRILQAAHRGRQVFAPEGRFPSALNQDVPLHPDAARWYERGPTFLQSWLPFWVAVTVERLWVLIIPLVTLGLPLIRFAPPIYTWQMESRVLRYYDDLRRIEEEAAAARDRAARDAVEAKLKALDTKVATLGIPSGYGALLYALRRDIAFVRDAVRTLRRG